MLFAVAKKSWDMGQRLQQPLWAAECIRWGTMCLTFTRPAFLLLLSSNLGGRVDRPRGPSARTIRAGGPRGTSARTVRADGTREPSARTVRAERPRGRSVREWV